MMIYLPDATASFVLFLRFLSEKRRLFEHQRVILNLWDVILFQPATALN